MGQEEPARRLYAHIVEREAELCCRVLFSPPVTYAQYPVSAVLVSNGGCTKARAIEVLAAQQRGDGAGAGDREDGGAVCSAE
jgi:hypothetical protein